MSLILIFLRITLQLREAGYDKFAEGYHPDSKDILEKRRRLLKTGEAFETTVTYKNSQNENEKFIVSNFLLNPETKDEDKLYFGEARSLKILEAKLNNNEINERLNSKEYFFKVFSEFSKRQLEIFWGIYQNCGTNKEIASMLFKAESTIKSNKQNIFDTLKVKNTAQLIKYVTTRLLLHKLNIDREDT